MVEGTDGQPFSSYKYITAGKCSANGSALLQKKEMLLVAKAGEDMRNVPFTKVEHSMLFNDEILIILLFYSFNYCYNNN